MKRDMDLVRALLLNVENNQDDDGSDYAPEIPGYSRYNTDHHIRIMQQAGLLEASASTEKGEETGSPERTIWVSTLTWKGYEFLDMARKEAVWELAKESTWVATGGLGFKGLKKALSKLIKQAIQDGQ